MNWGIKVLQTCALPLGHGAIYIKYYSSWQNMQRSNIYFYKSRDAKTSLDKWSGRRDSNSRRSPWQGDALPLSHSRIAKLLWCLRAESNHRHGDFQSPALPTELQRQVVFRQTTLFIIAFSFLFVKNFFHLLENFLLASPFKDDEAREVAGDPDRARTDDLQRDRLAF